jgi:hypothetical protein
MSDLNEFGCALLATVVIETIVLCLVRVVFRKRFGDPRWGTVVLAGSLPSIVTLPYLWFVLPPLMDAARGPLPGEALVLRSKNSQANYTRHSRRKAAPNNKKASALAR